MSQRSIYPSVTDCHTNLCQCSASISDVPFYKACPKVGNVHLKYTRSMLWSQLWKTYAESEWSNWRLTHGTRHCGWLDPTSSAAHSWLPGPVHSYRRGVGQDRCKHKSCWQLSGMLGVIMWLEATWIVSQSATRIKHPQS